ncbi:Uncharacterised protein [Mycobacteroides abscessus subsp. abscessus]|nr:Uncharacterised protein [Mycobacteroides abscessus subsp. abscessus]
MAHRITSACWKLPSAQRTPSGSMWSNIGRRASAPRRWAARSRSFHSSPVTETTEPGGSPRRTRSSTWATAARPASGVNSPSRNTGSRRVTQVVLVTWDISSSNCTAEIPPPTTTTCLPANSAASW